MTSDRVRSRLTLSRRSAWAQHSRCKFAERGASEVCTAATSVCTRIVDDGNLPSETASVLIIETGRSRPRRGSAAHGYFELTKSLAKYTQAKVLIDVGVKIELFVRFSTVAGGAGSVDTPRDVRGFTVKLYTKERNWDLVGNNMRAFAGLELGRDAIPDETTILNFRHLLERHDLTKAIFEGVAGHLAAKGVLLRGTIVDATLIAASPSTKN